MERIRKATGDLKPLMILLDLERKEKQSYQGYMARMKYLQEQGPGLYTRLLLSGKLNDDLHQTDVQVHHLLDVMIPQMAKEAGVTEELKIEDQLRWVGMMNVIKNQVEEIVWSEVVYK